MQRECRERFPRHRLLRKPLVSDPGMHHGTCVTHVPWCMSGSLTCGGGANVPSITGACATRNFGIWQEAHACHFARECQLINVQLTVWRYSTDFTKSYIGTSASFNFDDTFQEPIEHFIDIAICARWHHKDDYKNNSSLKQINTIETLTKWHVQNRFIKDNYSYIDQKIG